MIVIIDCGSLKILLIYQLVDEFIDVEIIFMYDLFG